MKLLRLNNKYQISDRNYKTAISVRARRIKGRSFARSFGGSFFAGKSPAYTVDLSAKTF